MKETTNFSPSTNFHKLLNNYKETSLMTHVFVLYEAFTLHTVNN